MIEVIQAAVLCLALSCVIVACAWPPADDRDLVDHVVAWLDEHQDTIDRAFLAGPPVLAVVLTVLALWWRS